MPVRIRTGGASGVWTNAAAGSIKIRSGGAWVAATKVQIASGGVWRDSGYVGVPNIPSAFAVSPGAPPYNWTFTTVTMQWTAPVGGAPVKHYQVVKTDAANNWLFSTTTTATSYSFGVSADERCKFLVQSVSTSDLGSGFVGPIGVQVGHPEKTKEVTTVSTRDWLSKNAEGVQAPLDVNLYLQNYVNTVILPANVHATKIYINVGNSESNTPWIHISPQDGVDNTQPYGRRLYWVFNDVVQWGAGGWQGYLNVPNPWYVNWGPTDQQGTGGRWGLAIDGLGFSQTALDPFGNPSKNRLHGIFQLFGTETYSTTSTVVDVARVDNSLW